MNKKIAVLSASILSLGLLLAGCSSEGSPQPTVTVTKDAVTPSQQPTEAPALTTEDAYIENLRSWGNYYVDINSDETLITTGYSVCTDLDDGYNVTDIISEILLSPDFDSSDSEAVEYVGLILGASVAAFCPEYTYQIEALV